MEKLEARVGGPHGASPCGASEMRETAELVYQSFAEYYDLFSARKGAILDAIVAQLEEPASEVGQTKVLRCGGAIVGAYACYDSEEMAERQLVSLRMLLDIAEPKDNIFPSLQRYRQHVSLVPEGALYLSRIAVAPACRGAGHGRQLLADFEEQASSRGRRLACLHVRSDNARARHFYRAAGYGLASDPHRAYLALQKSVAA